MYFTVNTAFVHYLDELDNLTDSLDILILMDKTTFEQTLPISLNASIFDIDLLTAPKTLKDFVHQYCHKKEISDFQERHNDNISDLPNKNFFLNNYIVDIFLFVTAIISLMVTIIVMYILCKHAKPKTLLTLQQIKEVGAVAKQEHVSIEQVIECTCKI